MTNSNNISISEATKWLLKVAAANGYSPEAWQVVADFAIEYGLNLEDIVEMDIEDEPKES